MTEADEKRLAALRAAMGGRTHYEGQEERTDEFLLRLLIDALNKLRASEHEMLAWRCVAQSWTPGGSEYCTLDAVQGFVNARRAADHEARCENVRLRRRAASAAYAHTRGEETVPAPLVRRLIRGENPVKVWREHRGLTAAALAEHADLSKSYLSQIEAGERTGTVATLKKIAETLKVDLDDLI